MIWSPRRPATADAAVIHQAASWCLSYPDDQMLSAVDVVDAALAEQPPGPAVDGLRRFLTHLRIQSPDRLRHDYIDLFDLSRHHALYLSYWTDGDTRRRGSVLGEFKQLYRDSGFLVDLHGELPDHLPIVLEFAARVDPDAGRRVLQDYRAALELLRLALIERDTPYADVLVAVCATLPGQSPADRASVMAMLNSGAQPAESVGLDAYDPRLLPLSTVPPGGRRRSEVS